MWTLENRPRYDRSKLRYPSDLTDEEWAHPTDDPAGEEGWQQANCGCADGDQRGDVHPEHGLSVGGAAEKTCRRVAR